MSILCSMVGASFAVAAAAEVVRTKKGIAALGNAQIDTAQSKFGGASALFDGTGDYLRVLPADFTFTSDFTIEGWMRINSKATKNSLVTFYSGATYRFHIGHESNADYGFVYYNASSGAILDSKTGGLGYAATNTGQWYHIALVRSGNVFTLYVDGTSRDTVTENPTISVDDLYIGAESNGSFSMNGHIDELRISKSARYTANFTPSTSPFVNDDNTLLLLHMNGTDASTFFEDDNGSVPSSSRTAVVVTANGNAQVDTAQSKFGGACALFDGTGDYLQVDPPIALGTGNFTVECWIRRDDIITDHIIVDFRDTGTQVAGTLYASNQTLIWFVNGAARITTGNVLTSTSVFYHVAVCRSGSDTKLFVDGTQQGSTYTDTNNYLGPNTRIGAAFSTGASDYDGWIDEFRISNSARYTAAFTPATAAFSNDANTLLLLHMDGADASTTFTDDNIPATRSQVGLWGTGSAALSTTQSKFGFSSLRTLSANVTKIAFSSQPLDTINTGPFTIEMWYRPDSVAQTTKVLLFTNEGGANRRGLIVNNQTVKYAIGGTDQITTGNLLTAANTWYHIALVRGVNNTTTLYVNGSSGGTYAGDTLSLASTGNNTIAALASGFTPDGYIDEFRISKTARYTSAFTPPTSAFTNDSDTVMLLHFDGTDASTVFRDDNGQTPPRIPKHISYYGNAQIDTAQSKFGGASALLDGNDYLQIIPATAADLGIGSGDFTIEGWVRFNSLTSGMIIDSRGNPQNGGGWCLYVGASSTLRWYYNFGDRITSSTLSTNTWYHFAMVRSGNEHKLYIDGTQTGSTYTAANTYLIGSATLGVWIGDNQPFSGNGLNGYLDEIRISNTARYTANFTPSTTPFVNDANTLLLLHADGVDATTIFVDDAGQRSQKGIAALGNAQIDTAQSKFGGSSALFDGTGDYLLVNSDPAFAYGTGDYTIEFWVYNSAWATEFIFDQRTTGTQIVPAIYYDGGIKVYVNGSDIISGGTLTANAWHHIALVKSGSDHKLYYNGTQTGSTYSYGGTYVQGGNLTIGTRYAIDTSYSGWIDEFRISNTARYTANFTAPTAPFQNDANTLLLLHMDGTDASTVFVDDNGRDTTPAA